tara:strand:+ start:2256 stop:3320 length:1065 start_codon:yes stop_codon:yes gene_type:complete
MSRAFNFSAGPAALPTEVLDQVKEELHDYQGTGMSVMEISHRSQAFISIAEKAEANLRDLLGIGDDFAVLFLQGGATLQFSMVPLNLLGGCNRADYLNTGAWSSKAIKEAERHAMVNVVANALDHVPAPEHWNLDDKAAYLHICSNETIGGVQFNEFPEVSVPLVADMSSDILSRPIDVEKFGLIYAGAQKNFGPAGLTVVIVRKELVGKARSDLPSMLNYDVHMRSGSMFNTPPVFSWYIAGLVFEWLKEQGGLEEIGKRNATRASKIYKLIDNSDLYQSPVRPGNRSAMNVTFTLNNAEEEGIFLEGAKEGGLFNLKGHRSVGGIRASIYNAVPEEGVDALIKYMSDFERAR